MTGSSNSSNPAITIGVVVGSFMIIACIGFVVSRMIRAKQRERLI